jgi:16S rRNA (uracil1498-N3)-methyltransferase
MEYWKSLKEKFRRPLGIMLHQEPLEKGTFHDYLGNCPDIVVLAVGPEGGFSQREAALFLAAGFRPLLMGNTVLRTETAALYGIAAIRIILLESEAWTRRLKE